MKKLLIATALVAGSWAGAAQAVTTITYTAGSGAQPSDVTVFQNFDSFAQGALLPGATNAYATSMTTDGVAARPAFGSTGNYGAVLGSGSYTVNFGLANAFSFVLGSLDTYNTLTLRYADGTSTVLNGGSIVNDPSFDSGNRTSGETNGVVTYRVTSGPMLTGATFASSANAFEIDNLAISAVPEPAAWGMMILGFGLVGGALRRRPTTKVKFA